MHGYFSSMDGGDAINSRGIFLRSAEFHSFLAINYFVHTIQVNSVVLIYQSIGSIVSVGFRPMK